MATLRIHVPGAGLSVYRIHKTLTSLGKSQDADVVLPDPSVGDVHALVQFDGHDFTIAVTAKESEVFVGGRRRSKHKLAHADRVRVGAIEMEFSLLDEPVAGESGGRDVAELASYKKFLEFSRKLMGNYEIPILLEQLLDAVIQLTNADKGFIVLLESNQPSVKVARNLRRETISDAVGQLSDSILAKVVETKHPLIVSDALRDAQFKNALSVVNLRLTSVMCVPLIERGQLFGVIYVGNDKVAHVFDEASMETLTVFAAQASLLIRNALLVNELKLDKESLEADLQRMRFGEILGAAPVMQEVFRKVQKVANTDVTVLVTGETGTGKELVAHEIHARSPRVKGPFVSVNCGAIPETLLESELFGHVRGAFTGAIANKPGRFQAANKGTLFLDEIGEMPLALQVKLLRALQERTVVRVGDNHAEAVDIRVVAATNRNLAEEIKAGRFREDLYYRLNVVQIALPPLREREDDLGVLARYFLARYAPEYGSKVQGFAPAAMAAMRRHSWPGNIRELENRVKKAVVLAESTMLGPADLGLEAGETATILPLAEARERWQRQYINEVLALCGGNRTQAARDLGVDPRTVFRHLEKESGANGTTDPS